MSLIKNLLSVTSDLREQHEKRSDPRSHKDAFREKLILPETGECYKISLGYLERFLIKADHDAIDSGKSEIVLSIDEWSEGCGLFEGKYSISKENEKIRSGRFEWAGRGSIEDTWDMFSVFE